MAFAITWGERKVKALEQQTDEKAKKENVRRHDFPSVKEKKLSH